MILIFLFVLNSCSSSLEEAEDKSAGEKNSADLIKEVNPKTSENSEIEIKEDIIEAVIIKENWLLKAEKAWFLQNDPELTEYCLNQIDRSGLIGENDRTLYRLLCRKIYSFSLSSENLLLDYRNVSRLFIDHDDLWMGTWSGGIGRYSLPLEELVLFRESRESLLVETVYDFLSKNNTILMAGYGPIYEYDRANSQFHTIFPQGPERINDLELFQGTLFASTVNQGIWYDRSSNHWEILDLPGTSSLINSLYRHGEDQLYIGTADKGILIYNGKSISNFNTVYPDFKGKNVTTLTANENYFLIGTYGEGGYLINRQTGKTHIFSESRGNLSSDYILSSSLDGEYAYLGTLGGGISAYSLNNDEPDYIMIGLEEGLLSLDVVSLVVYENKIIAANLGQGIIVIREKIIETKL